MTRKQKEKDIEKKVRKLIRESSKGMCKNIKRAISCGALDIDSHEGNYILPKIIFHALLKEVQFQYQFVSDDKKKMEKAADNVFNML